MKKRGDLGIISRFLAWNNKGQSDVNNIVNTRSKFGEGGIEKFHFEPVEFERTE